MRQPFAPWFCGLVCVLVIVALIGTAGKSLARSEWATPVVDNRPATTEIATAAPARSSTADLVTPSGGPPATPASAPRRLTLDAEAPAAPILTVTDFNPVTSTFTFPQGYAQVSTTATITLAATGESADIAPWRITIQGDGARPLVAPTEEGFSYMDFNQLRYQGFSATVEGASADNVGTTLSIDPASALVIAHGDGAGFSDDSPKTLSFGVVLTVTPYWSNLPGVYSGGLVLTISGSAP